MSPDFQHIPAWSAILLSLCAWIWLVFPNSAPRNPVKFPTRWEVASEWPGTNPSNAPRIFPIFPDLTGRARPAVEFCRLPPSAEKSGGWGTRLLLQDPDSEKLRVGHPPGNGRAFPSLKKSIPVPMVELHANPPFDRKNRRMGHPLLLGRLRFKNT